MSEIRAFKLSMVPIKKLRYDFFYVLGVITPEMQYSEGGLPPSFIIPLG